MELLQFARSRRGGELIGIVILAAGISLSLALLTYHPDDSSAFYTSTNSVVANWIGYYGATIAWLFVGFFGFASLLFPGALLVAGWNRICAKEIEYLQTKAIGLVILIIAAPPLCDLAFGKVWLRGALIPSGGYSGRTQSRRVIELERDRRRDRARDNDAGRPAARDAHQPGRDFRRAASQTPRPRTRVFAAVGALHRTPAQREDEDGHRPQASRRAIAAARAEHGCRAASGCPGPIVREVRGAGRFQIRKVTKADLRKAAEELSRQETPDPFALWAAAKADTVEAAEFSRPVAVEDDGEFEDPLYLDDPPAIRPPRPKPQMPRPVQRKQKETPAKRETKLTHDYLPPVDLLTAGPKQDTINDDIHKRFLDIGHLIEERCREFSVDGEVTAYHPGPVVTTFEFKPSTGVKYAKVVNLGDDLALALKAESIRIERISGSSTVGIEVPNKRRELITLRDIIDTDAFTQQSSLLTLALGKDIHGDAIVTDLARMPHLLVAGATGAGKSVGLNSMIVSLLYKALPKQLRMLMIDPKMVELKMYEDIPHLLHPIVTDPKLASVALIWAVNEMENRYRCLAECGVRNIDQYNGLLKDVDGYRRAMKLPEGEPVKVPEPLVYIVIIIDEFADLMMVASKDVEDSVTRLAQKARARSASI